MNNTRNLGPNGNLGPIIMMILFYYDGRLLLELELELELESDLDLEFIIQHRNNRLASLI